MSKPFTISDIKASPCGHLNPHLEDGKAAKKSKYGSVIIRIDGYVFRSLKESRRYVELRMLQTAGEISDLKLQIPYELNQGGTHSYKYIADFEYVFNGVKVTEDCKGMRTTVYKKKAKLMLELFGIQIKET